MILANLAFRQHGVVTRDQVLALGFSDAAIAKRVKAGRLHRVHRGVYAVGHARLSEKGTWMAGALAAGPGAFLSHLSAALLFNLWRRKVSETHVLAPRTRAPRGVRVHTYRTLDPLDISTHEGIPVTTIARMLVDISDTLTPHQTAYVIHEAEFRGLYDERAALAAIDRAQGRRLEIVRRAIELNRSGSAGTRSDNEDKFLAIVARAQLPEPLVNTRFQGFEVDFVWPDRLLHVEVDGGGHGRRRTKREDRALDLRMKAAGYRTIRIPESDLWHRPAAVLAKLTG